MKLKTINFSVIILVVTLGIVFLNGCKDQEAQGTEFSEETNINSSSFEKSTVVDLVQISQGNENLDHFPVSIGFSPVAYKLMKNHPNAQEIRQFILEKRGEPISILVNQNFAKVIDVEEISTDEKAIWEETNRFIQKIDEVDNISLDIDLNTRSSSVDYSGYSISSIFNFLQNNSCDYNTNTYEYGCISFPYKRDGCYARAHRMWELLENNYDKTCYKIFVYSDVDNEEYLNVPGCNYGWRYHVAPLIYANSTWYVIDPSLSNTPLTRSQWYSIMGSNNICDVDYRYDNNYMPLAQSMGCGSHSYYSDNTLQHTYWILENYQNNIGCY